VCLGHQSHCAAFGVIVPRILNSPLQNGQLHHAGKKYLQQILPDPFTAHALPIPESSMKKSCA